MNTFSKFLLPATIGSLLIGCFGPQCPNTSTDQNKNCPVISQINGSCGNLNSILGQNGSCNGNSGCIQNGSYDLNSILNQILGNFNFGNTGNGNQNQGNSNQGGSNQGNNNQGNNNQGQNKPDVSLPDTNNSLSSTAQSYIAQVVTLVNEERAKNGLSALTYDSTLQSAAQVRAEEIVGSFSHTRPDGTYYSSVLKEFSISYRRSGENIAWGQKTPEEVVTAWMNSSGHRANILNANYNKIGVGCNISASGTIYWSQLFTN